MIYMRFQLYLYTWSLCPMIYMRFQLYLYSESLYSMIYMRFHLYAPICIYAILIYNSPDSHSLASCMSLKTLFSFILPVVPNLSTLVPNLSTTSTTTITYPYLQRLSRIFRHI